MIKVLVSNPSAHPYSTYLPLLWGRLRAYCEFNDQRDFAFVHWHDPIFFGRQDLIEHYAPPAHQVDVLLLSCYVWNFQRNLDLAKKYKRDNPKVLVVAGGPHVDSNAINFFEDHPVVDVVCYGEGEAMVAELLYRKEHGQNFSGIDGLYTKELATSKAYKAPALDLSTCRSPLVEYKKDFLRFVETIKTENSRIIFTQETNRGCPFSCTFCDWGSSTNSRVRLFDEQVIKKEIEVLADLSINLIHQTDANFGLFKRDLDFIKDIVQAKKRSGSPELVVLNGNKNQKERVGEAYRLLFENEMMYTSQIALQHTDSDVLRAIDRENMSMDAIVEELNYCFTHSIPTVAVLIAGCPGDTLDKWRNALFDVLRMGFHEDMVVFDFWLLPNAPANDEVYKNKWQIETIERPFIELHNGKRLPIQQTLIASTKSYSKEDYAEMQTWSFYIQAMHILGCGKFLSLFAYYGLGIDYQLFYSALFEMTPVNKFVDVVRQHMLRYVRGDVVEKFMDFDGQRLMPDHWLHAQLVSSREEMWPQIKNYFLHKGVAEDLVDDLIAFQDRSLVGWWPQEDCWLTYDLSEFFAAVFATPPAQKGIRIEIKKKARRLSTKQSSVGLFKNVEISHISNRQDWVKTLLHQYPHVRHKTFYYSDLISGSL